MFRYKTTIGLTTAVLAAALLASLAYATGQQTGVARIAPPPAITGAGTFVPPPPFRQNGLAPAEPAALSSILSYYFIPGNTFTPDARIEYFRQVNGCVSQMPVGFVFSAPVHLPQGSQVVSMTLYTYDNAVTTTISAAYLMYNNGSGGIGYYFSASSQPSHAGYQQNTSTEIAPASIDNQARGYLVQWFKPPGNDSPYLGLCGVRLAYYAPLGVAAYLPAVQR